MKVAFSWMFGSMLALSPMAHQVQANIITGHFEGVLTGSSGGRAFPYADGAPVSGYFSYNSALLTGGGSTSYWDPSVIFRVSIDGQGFGTWGGPSDFGMPNRLSFYVDANGFPSVGNSASLFDLYIDGGFLSFNSYGVYWGTAEVTYTIPDACATSTLVGLSLLTLLVVTRLDRPNKAPIVHFISGISVICRNPPSTDENAQLPRFPRVLNIS
jgi:hypothetical protein